MVTPKPVRDYLAAFDLCAVFITCDGDVRVGLDPDAEAAWWTTRRDAHRVADGAKAMKQPDIVAAARELDIPLTEHRVAIARARAAVERISAVFSAAQSTAVCDFSTANSAGGSSGRPALHALYRGSAAAPASAGRDGSGRRDVGELAGVKFSNQRRSHELVTRALGPQPAPVPPPAGAAAAATLADGHARAARAA